MHRGEQRLETLEATEVASKHDVQLAVGADAPDICSGSATAHGSKLLMDTMRRGSTPRRSIVLAMSLESTTMRLGGVVGAGVERAQEPPEAPEVAREPDGDLGVDVLLVVDERGAFAARDARHHCGHDHRRSRGRHHHVDRTEPARLAQ